MSFKNLSAVFFCSKLIRKLHQSLITKQSLTKSIFAFGYNYHILQRSFIKQHSLYIFASKKGCPCARSDWSFFIATRLKKTSTTTTMATAMTLIIFCESNLLKSPSKVCDTSFLQDELSCAWIYVSRVHQIKTCRRISSPDSEPSLATKEQEGDKRDVVVIHSSDLLKVLGG